MMKNMNTNPTRLATMAVSAITQLVTNIITTEPISMTTAVTKVTSDWLSVWPIMSTSLVTRESTSPTACESKYFKGRRLIFCEMAVRSALAFFCVTEAMISPWIYENSSPQPYSTTRRMHTRVTAAMSMGATKPASMRSVRSST